MSLPFPEAEAPGLPPEYFARAFPFFLAWNHELRITSTGASLNKVCPAALPGALLTDLLRLKRPAGAVSPTFFARNGDFLFLFEIIANGINLRGQIFPSGQPGAWVMLAAPWLTDPKEVEALGLTLSDFALHDQTMDLLQIAQVQRMANADLQKLTAKLTEQRARLREKEAESRKLALVAACTDNAVIVTDATGRIEWVNNGFISLTGWRLEEVTGKTPGSFLQGPESDPDTVDMMRLKLSRGEGFRTEIINYDRHGRKYWISLEIQPVYNETGILTNFTALATDITERMRSEMRRGLQYSVSRTLAGAHTLRHTGIFIVKTICLHLGWSVGCLWLPNPTRKHLIFSEAWHDPTSDFSHFINTSRQLAFRSGEGLPGRAWATGTSAWVPDVTKDPLFDRASVAGECGLHAALALPFFSSGEFQGLMEFFSPTIEEPDEALLQTLDSICNQIGQFIVRKNGEEELIRAKETAEFANRAKSDFLATMSHEIRTPMNGVLGFTQLLQQSPLSTQQDEFVSAIRSSAESLLTVINDVLDFSKIESGHMDIEHHPFSLQTCLEEALETVSTSAAEKRLDLACLTAAGVPASVFGDALRLRQVLVNLLGNAVKFTLQGEIQFSVDDFPSTPGRTGIEFQVRDTGIGIPADQLGTLFEPFQQGDSSTSRCFGGTGLGLAICRRLVELMGGTINAISNPGEGSVFSFRLEFEVASSPPPAVAPVPYPGLAGRRALIIDSHRLSRFTLTELLTRWGMETRSAATPEEAARHLTGWTPHVLLLDASSAHPAELSFSRKLVKKGTTLFVMGQPSDGLALRQRFGEDITGTLFKPLKVSPLFNALLSHDGNLAIPTVGGHRPLLPIQSKARPVRLLLAEDNAINRKLAIAALGQMGCTADVAIDGNEALRAAKTTRYDAILMDVQMPDMDGLEATRQIRQWETETATPRTRIIALTANALSGDREICLRSGMDDYLSKPIRLESLRTALQSACDATEADFSALTHFPDPTEPSPAAIALRQLADELSPEDAISLAAEFLDDLPAQLSAIQQSLALNNAEAAKRFAHSLKGTSSIFHLPGLRAAAESIETAAQEGRLAEATTELAGLQSTAHAAIAELRTAIAALTSTAALSPMS